MHSQRDLFLNALMFYTRIPVPKDTPYSPEILNASRKYFTSVGIVIGLICCISLVVLNLVLPISVAVLGSMVIGILATGAFHEDGFADTCDAFGGGWTKEQVLTIMKDSRIGTYGTVALISMLALKYALLLELANISLFAVCACIVAAHGSSRHHSSRVIGRYAYVQDIDQSKVKPIANAELGSDALRFSMLIALIACLPMALYSLSATFLGMLMGYAGSQLFIEYSNKRIGGYTGDVLGAIQQLSEVLFLISCLIIL